MNKVKKNDGITLIALIVTMIVLIILGTTFTKAILSDNGLLKKSNNLSSSQKVKLDESDTQFQNMLEQYDEISETRNVYSYILFSEPEWATVTNYVTAKVRIYTNEPEYTLLYKKNSGEWQVIQSGAEIADLRSGDTIYAKLMNGNNVICEEQLLLSYSS